MEEDYKSIQLELEKLYRLLMKETTTEGLEIVNKIVELEIEAEKFCNY